jgi:N-acetylglucosamine kinase-like BadF-type ATPase
MYARGESGPGPAAAHVTAAVLAIDGGNSKTDVALVSRSGELLAHVRGPGSSPHQLGVDGSAALLDDLVAQVAARVGLDSQVNCAEYANVYLAGVDIPAETVWIREAVVARRWSPQVVVDNDTVALLRAGTDAPNAVAVVCGAGINCLGVSAGGAEVRFPSLGAISGDWGGGEQLGAEALWWAARGADGRAKPTVLQAIVPEHLGRPDVQAVIEDLHFGRMAESALGLLAPKVLWAASALSDHAACAIVDRLADEVVVFAVTALRRLGLLDQATEVVLGGGVLTSGDPLLLALIRAGLAAQAPQALVKVTEVPPVVGAALLGLDRLPATPEARARLRSSLTIELPSEPAPVSPADGSAFDAGQGDAFDEDSLREQEDDHHGQQKQQ